jgi:predicted nucleic acid-binding protein
VYFDTSVVIALADPLDAFHYHSVDFVYKIATGSKHECYVSSPLLVELGRIAKIKGPKRCFDIVNVIEDSGIQFSGTDLKVIWELSQSYLAGRALTSRHLVDLLHYAAASLLNCSCIVSWNTRQFNDRIANKISRINGEKGLPSLIAGTPNKIARLKNLG